jgi:hypothetical protein
MVGAGALEQAASAFRNLCQLLERRFELSFEIRDLLDRSADCSRDLLKVRVCVDAQFKLLHFGLAVLSFSSN